MQAHDNAKPDALAQWMGRDCLPRKRVWRLKVLEAFVESEPSKLDGLVAKALSVHVAEEGLKRTAPWLAGLVARALIAQPKGETHAQLDALYEQGSYAVTAYREPAAIRGIALLGAAMASGWRYEGFRRGVLRDNRLDTMKIWTVRIRADGGQRLVAVAAADLGKLDATLVGRVLDSVKRLCPSSLVWTESANEQLAAGCAERQLAYCAAEEPAEVLRMVAAIPDQEMAAPKAPRLSPLAEAIRAESIPSVDDILELVRSYRRTYQCFEAIRGLHEEEYTDVGERLAILLEAAHQVAPERARLNEGQSIVLRQIAEHPDGAVAKRMRDEALLQRYGGTDLFELAALGPHWLSSGWRLRRVVQGATRREREKVESLASSAAGLWRLVLENNGLEAELWYLPSLQGEDTSGLEVLLPEHRPCVVVVAQEGQEPGWLEGSKAVAFRLSGEEKEQLAEHLARLQVS